jgi:acyl-CoA synthetase (AMP-forming)/AMP-acid ligase II
LSDILDGIGFTEMLHIFLSNYPGDVKYGTIGKPVPGYDVRLVDDHGNLIEEAAVVGWQDEDKLIKAKAIVVLKSAKKVGRGTCPRAEGARQDCTRTLQISALDRIPQGAPKDNEWQVPAFQAQRRDAAIVNSRMRELIALLRALESPAREGAWYPTSDGTSCEYGPARFGQLNDRNVM